MLRDLCERFAVLSESELRVDGAVVPAVVPPKSPWATARVEPRAAKAMAQRLYDEAYCRRGFGSVVLRRRSRISADELLEALSGANAGTACVDPGWAFEGATASGDLRVRKFGIAFVAPADSVIRSKDSNVCDVRIGKEMRWYNPGFYLALGDVAPSPADALSRVYWHATARAAVSLMAGVTRALNEEKLPFRFKVLSVPEAFVRADAAVLYIPRANYLRTMMALRSVYAAVKPALREPSPLFTLPIAPGIGVADDPGRDEESFGQNRCRLVAEGLWHARGIDTPDARAEAVRGRLEEARLDLARLHLRARGAVDYEAVAMEHD